MTFRARIPPCKLFAHFLQCFFKDGHDPRIGVLSEIAEAVGKVTHAHGKFTTTGNAHALAR